jgi:hypothetical protein
MVTPEDMISADGQHALQDMVEFEMYLVAQAQATPWPILRRGMKKLESAREPHSSLVESIAAKQLARQGYIEATSNRTFVVSKSGYEFYEREIKPRLGLTPPAAGPEPTIP